MSYSKYSREPKDWRRVDDIGCWIGSIGGGLRLLCWLVWRGEWDGSVVSFDRVRCSEEMGVGVKQVDRWRQELCMRGLVKRHIESRRLWVHGALLVGLRIGGVGVMVERLVVKQ